MAGEFYSLSRGSAQAMSVLRGSVQGAALQQQTFEPQRQTGNSLIAPQNSKDAKDIDKASNGIKHVAQSIPNAGKPVAPDHDHVVIT